ncbi:MAG TPA: hypothetical protein VM056_07300 [Terriglobales bacterium]|nr:hypothetical protein [Terriglobales bacterium]
MKQVKRFRVFTVAKIMGVLWAAMGLLFIPIALIISAASLGQTGRTGFTGVAGGVMLAVLAPIIYGTIGFVVGAISAWLYNLMADKVGGIEMLLEDVHDQRSAAARA